MHIPKHGSNISTGDALVLGTLHASLIRKL